MFGEAEGERLKRIVRESGLEGIVGRQRTKTSTLPNVVERIENRL
jgi:hypothetical protein